MKNEVIVRLCETARCRHPVTQAFHDVSRCGECHYYRPKDQWSPKHCEHPEAGLNEQRKSVIAMGSANVVPRGCPLRRSAYVVTDHVTITRLKL